MNAEQLDKAVRGKVIKRVEAGTTPGWLVAEFEPGEGDENRTLLTVFVGGNNEHAHSEKRHFALAALHTVFPDEYRSVSPIRDDRDPHMRLNEEGWQDWLHPHDRYKVVHEEIGGCHAYHVIDTKTGAPARALNSEGWVVGRDEQTAREVCDYLNSTSGE